MSLHGSFESKQGFERGSRFGTRLYIPASMLFHCSGIVKLTAQFVARNGAQFLDKLMMREQVRNDNTCLTSCPNNTIHS